ncbi:MAG: amino acid ABC transporter ATP-binding protein [Siculibacillus sp.]|nr:amino acid ABC transporter ATP-binding protein [Siculibacillus sp.]
MQALVATDIRKAFGPLEVLRGISLKADKGDVIAIIGGSGSGKSTFLRCLNLLERPDAGSLWLNGLALDFGDGDRARTIAPATKAQLRRRLGMVFQSFNLWTHMTALDNVIAGPIHVLGQDRKAAREAGMELLGKVGLADKAAAHPAQLSGGQQQRVAIARALAMRPEALLFDEPTSALDPELVGEVLQVIKALAAEGRTMILVTHEMAFARDVATHVMYFLDGRVEEEGAPDRIFTDPRSERCRSFLRKFL